MDRLVLVALLTALIHLINTLIYSVRVSGVSTGRLAIAISLFNVIFLVSSTANMIQGPLLATIVEGAIHSGGVAGLPADMTRSMSFPPAYIDQLDLLAGKTRIIILAATAGTLVGGLLIPWFINVFIKAINIFDRVGSIPGMLVGIIFHPRRMAAYAQSQIPEMPVRRDVRNNRGLPRLFMLMNVAVTGVFTTGVLSALYAGALYPDYRAAATLLAPLVNGVAQVLFATVVDPAAARITDQAMQGERDAGDVRRMSYYLAATRLAGTLLAQAIFIPAAYLIRLAAVAIT